MKVGDIGTLDVGRVHLLDALHLRQAVVQVREFVRRLVQHDAQIGLEVGGVLRREHEGGRRAFAGLLEAGVDLRPVGRIAVCRSRFSRISARKIVEQHGIQRPIRRRRRASGPASSTSKVTSGFGLARRRLGRRHTRVHRHRERVAGIRLSERDLQHREEGVVAGAAEVKYWLARLPDAGDPDLRRAAN